MRLTKMFVSGFIALFCWSGSLFADYTIVLKNGGRITVKSYREESGMVKFHGLGGEIGIARQQIQSILQASKTEPQGIVIAAIKNSPSAPEAMVTLLTSEEKLGQVPASPDVRRFRRKDKEQGEYQTVQEGLTGGIKSRTHRYWQITRGTIDPEPVLLETLKALQGRIDDLNSRLKDAQHNPRRAMGTGIVNLITNSMFAGRKNLIGLRHEGVIGTGRVNVRRVRAKRVGRLLPGYSKREKELSELRNLQTLLYQERERLMEEVERRDLFAGSPPYEAYPSINPKWWRERYGQRP